MNGRNQSPTPAWLAATLAAWLAVFFRVPFSIMLSVSVAHRVPGGYYQPGFEWDSYARFFSSFFGQILATSLALSVVAALLRVGLAFPFTIFPSRMRQGSQTIVEIILLAVLSLSEVIVGFSLSTSLSQTAGVGKLVAWLGIIDAPRAFTPGLGAVTTGMCYMALPYAVLLLYSPVSRPDPDLTEAARMMGASPMRNFMTVTLPLLRGPILGALILVAVFTLGVYLLQQVLGRPEQWTLSIYIADQAVFQSNLPFTAAMAVLLILVSLALVGLTLLLAGTEGTR